MTEVAERHDVTRQHIYQWRRQLKEKGVWPEVEGVAFLALDGPEQPVMSLPGSTGSSPVEICFANGRSLRCPSGMTDAEIIQLIRLVETA